MPSDPNPRAQSAARAPIDVRRFPWIRKLATDYAFEFSALSGFFAADPALPDSWRDMVARTLAYERPREGVADCLAAQQASRRAPAEAVTAAARLRDARTVAVVTGQQAGLFGGPLYTLLKALSALKLAERLSAEQGTPAVAVFWVEAEDHDWDEVSACTVLDGDLQPRRIALGTPEGAGRVPVAAVHLDDAAGVEAALTALEAALPPSEFVGPLMASLREAYNPGRSMADAFARWIESVLGRRGLVVFDASDRACKPLVSDVFRREIEAPDRTTQLVSTAGAALEQLGYHAQVTPQEGPAVFHLDGQRTSIVHERGQFVIGRTSCSAAELLARVTENPEAFSPNVLLRPIVQDTLFPTVCYVSGPSELAYQAQLRGVYEHFGVPMPLFYPRVSATILDSGAVRFLDRYDVPFDAFQAQDDGALNHLLQTQLPPHVEEIFQQAARAIAEQMSAVEQAVPAIDPTLAGAARSTLGKMQHDLKAFHGKMIQAAKRRDDTLRRQFERVRLQAFPGGHPQERTVAFVSFLARYGPALVDRLDETLPLDLGQHWVVTI